jgi:Tol biopolymer transport system component
MKAPLEGGAPTQLSGPRSFGSAISPDGKLLAFFHQPEQEPSRIVVIPFEGGPPVKTFDHPVGVTALWGLRWTPDGRTLTYIKSDIGVANVWGQPLTGGAPKPLTDFKSEAIRAFDWSRDGRLAVSRGVVNSDVVLISGFK